MSKIAYFIEFLPKGLANADKVVEGVINQVKMKFDKLSEEEQEEIIRRRLICNSCPFNSINAKTSEEYFNIFGEHYSKSSEPLHCSICSCVINTKTAGLGNDCGIKADEKTKHLELKWKAFNKTK